jgi:hypothetical protein
MTPTESRKVWDLEMRMERQAQQRKVRWFLAAMAFGAFSLWVLIETVVAVAHWLGGAL